MKAKELAFGLSFVVGLLGLLASGCDESQVWHFPHVSEERMIDPHHSLAYDPNAFFENAQAMQVPPEGTFVHAEIEPPFAVDGRYVERIPVPVTERLVDLGQARFGVTCAACHGVVGDGDSIVATKMQGRRPPSLHEARIVALPVGRLYEIIRDGYGLMGSYAPWLTTAEERWAVVAYVRALQLSQDAVVRDLPADVRADLAREAP